MAMMAVASVVVRRMLRMVSLWAFSNESMASAVKVMAQRDQRMISVAET